MKPLHQSIRRVTAVVAIMATMLLTVGIPAQAHSGKGTIQVESVEMIGPLTVRYVVAITFDADGHAAPDATATVVGEADGLRVGPVQMAPVAAGNQGRYAATVNLPDGGSWKIRFSSLDPTAVLERSETLKPPTETTPIETTPTETAPITTATSTTRSVVDRTSRDTPQSTSLDEPAASTNDPATDNSAGIAAAGVLVVLLVIGVGVAIRWRRIHRRRDDA